jgi:hypothetical protein
MLRLQAGSVAATPGMAVQPADRAVGDVENLLVQLRVQLGGLGQTRFSAGPYRRDQCPELSDISIGHVLGRTGRSSIFQHGAAR